MPGQAFALNFPLAFTPPQSIDSVCERPVRLNAPFEELPIRYAWYRKVGPADLPS